MNSSAEGGKPPDDKKPDPSKTDSIIAPGRPGASFPRPDGSGRNSASEEAEGSFSQAVGKGLKAIPTQSWASQASSASSDEELESFTELWWFLGHSQDTNVIFVPSDFEAVYPKGYASIMSAAKLHKFVVTKEGPKMLECGFRNKECYAADTQRAKERFSKLEKSEQASASALMTLSLLAEFKPTVAVTFESRTGVPSSYVLSIFLKEFCGSASIAKAMKHEDGGRAEVLDRLSACFATDRSIAGLLLATLDKIYRSNAKLAKSQNDQMLVDLAQRHCLTSDEGILQNHFKITRKVEKVEVGTGKLKSQQTVVKTGRIVPNLMVGSDLLKESERSRLKIISSRFNLNEIYARKISGVGSIITKVEIAERLVKEAYQVVDPICSIVKRRKALIRSSITPEKGKPITAKAWSEALTSVLPSVEDLAEDVYGRLEEFCR